MVCSIEPTRLESKHHTQPDIGKQELTLQLLLTDCSLPGTSTAHGTGGNLFLACQVSEANLKDFESRFEKSISELSAEFCYGPRSKAGDRGEVVWLVNGALVVRQTGRERKKGAAWP